MSHLICSHLVGPSPIDIERVFILIRLVYSRIILEARHIGWSKITLNMIELRDKRLKSLVMGLILSYEVLLSWNDEV